MPRKKRPLQARETEYNGISFFSQTQAQYGIWLDELGGEINYCPPKIRLLNGTYFCPTFLLEDVLIQGNREEYELDELYIKVNGMENTPAETIKAIMDDPDLHVLFVGGFPFGLDMGWVDSQIHKKHHKHNYLWNFKTVDGQDTVAYLGLNNDGLFKIFRPDIIYPLDRDEDMSFDAYKTGLTAFMDGDKIAEYFEGTYNPFND